MLLIEKVQELQAIQPPLETGEINRRIQEWKKQTNYEAPEKVKSTGAAKQTDANASPKDTPEASESLGSGNGKSQSGLFSNYLQTGIDPFLNEDFKDVFKRSSGKELDKIYNEFEAQKISNIQDGLGGELEEVIVTAKRDPFSYSVIGEGLGLSGLLADSDNIYEQRLQQERLNKVAESKKATTVANLIETGTISPLDENSERGKDQNLYHNKSFFGKYFGGIFNYRGADVDDIKNYTRNVLEVSPYVLAMDYEGGVDFDYIAEEESLNQKLGGKDTGKIKRKRTSRLNRKQIETKINEIERTGTEDASGNVVYTPENKKKLEDLYELKEDAGGDLFVPIDINEAYNYQINSQVDNTINTLSDSKKASYLNKVKNQGVQQLSDEEKNIRDAELKIKYKLYENDEEKQKLEKYLVSKEEFYGKKLYDDEGNFIDFKKAKTESQIVEEASILSDDNDVDFLEDQLLKSNVKVVELSKALLELDEYKKQASFIGPDVKAGRLKGTLVEGSKLLSDKLSLKDNEVKLLEEIIKTGLIPEDYKYLSTGSRSSDKLNEALQEYQILNTALQLNKNPLSVKNREYTKTFVNTVKEIGSYDYGIKTAPLRLRKDGMRAFEGVLLNNGYSERDVNYFSKNIENNFGENVIAGVVGLGNISIQLGAARGAGVFTGVSKLLRAGKISSQMYFRARGMKWAYKPTTHFFNGVLEGTEFMALGAAKNLALDQKESLGGSFGFGFAMKAGGGLYTDLFKYFNKRLINTSLATPLAYLDDYASVRMFRQRSREAFGGSSSFMIGSAVTDPIGTYDRGFKDFMKHYGQEYVNMFMYGNMSRALKTKGGSLKAARDAMENDFLGFSNYSVRAKNGANLLNIDKNIIQKPNEESNNIIDSKVENKIIEINKRLENKEITEDQAAKELIKIEEAQSAVVDQVIVNQVKSLVKERREADDYPSKGDVYRTMQKFSTGEKFDARDSEVFEKMSPEEILKSMGGEYSKENIRAIEQLQDRENKIQAIMNGGDMLVVKTEGAYEYIPPSTYKVIKSNKSLRNEVYAFLDKKLSLDSTIQRLQATEKSGMSPLEKEALENEIKESTKELDAYKEGGSEAIKIQEKVNKAAEVEIEKSKAQDIQAQEKFPIITSKGESNVEYLPEDQYKQKLKEAGVEGGEDSTAVTLPNGTRLVNETKAKEIKDFSTGSHETAGHAVFFDVFKDNQGKVTEEGIKFIDDMLNILPESQRKQIQLEVQDRYPDLVTKDKKEWYEENLAIMAEYMREGKIKYSESIGEKIRGIVPFMKRKGFDKLNIEKPEDAFKLMQGLTSGVKEAQKAASEASIEQAGKRLTEEAVSGVESKADAVFSESKRKLTPEQDKQAQDKVKEIQELQKESEALAEKYNKPFIKGAKQQRLEKELFSGDIKDTIDSFVESRTKALYDPIAASNKENLTRQQFIESMKSDIETMVIGEFKAKQPLEKFITSRGYLRANSLAERLGVASVEEGITKSIDDTTKQIIGEETKAETVATDIAEKPTEKTIFNKDLLTTEFLDTIKIEEAEAINKINKDLAEGKIKEKKKAEALKRKVTKNVIENKITKTITEAYEGRDVTGFKDLGSPKFPIPKPVAQLYADMFGIKTVEGLTKKAQNFYPRDRNGLRNLQKFLIENSLYDYNRLPKTVSDIGKATGIKQTKLGKIMYNDNGVKVGTIKQYRDIIQGKNITLTIQNGTQKGESIEFNKRVKDISRGDLQQNLKTSWDFLAKNRALETLVPEQGKRIQAGAKFSQAKKIKEPKVMDTKKEIIQSEDYVPVERGKKGVDRTREFVLGPASDIFGVDIVRDIIATNKVLSTAGNRAYSYKSDGKIKPGGGAVGGGYNFVTNVQRLLADYGPGSKKQSSKTVQDTLELIEAGELGDLSVLQKELSETKKQGIYSKKDRAAIKRFIDHKNAREGGVEKNTKDIAEINRGKKLMLDGFRKIYELDNSSFPLIAEVSYSFNSNRNPFRDLATLVGEMKGLKKGEKTWEEHIMQFGMYTNEMLKAIKGSKKAWNSFVDWSNDNYFQLKLSKEASNLIDQNFIDAKDAFGNKLDNWNAKSQFHPLQIESFKKAEKEGDYSKVIDPMIRAYNEYVSLNPFSITRLGVTDAKRYLDNIEVSKVDQNNLDVQSKAAELISKVIKSEAGFLTGSNAVSRKKAKELLNNYLKTSKQESKQAEVNNNLQPNALKFEGQKSGSSKTVVDELNVLDKALNNARVANFSAPKKIRVFDFDDTLAKSKSKVLYTTPNVEGGFSEGTTNLKAIFMVGGPGAGKTNVGKGLQLGRRGYKVVNQDIALESMKKEAGLPAKESDYTAEQRSTRSKLGAAARKAAVTKFDKYAENGLGMVVDGTGASYNATTKKIKALEDKGYEVHMVVATTPLETAISRNKARVERSLPDFVVKKTYESVQESLKKYREDFGGRLYEINTETIEYGKPLPAEFLKQVYAGINTNKVGKINATEFAEQASTLEKLGAEFDFREFSKVVEGEKGPLFGVAEKIAAARGTDDLFILTARPQDAAGPIQAFMKANGINIPLKNITGLGDGTAAAKGRWIAGKAAEGYNDFYFADDAIKNVKAVKDVLSQVDVKSKVQQAKFSNAKNFDKIFNDIIEAKTGIESYKQFSAAKAKTIGANKGKFGFFIPASAEDFTGLLYRTLGKGRVGDAQMAFYKQNLLDPYNRAEMAISQAKVAAGRDYKALKKQFKNIPKTLEKETGISKFKYQHAIRTYIWDKQGLEVPGLSKRDQKRLVDFVSNDAELSVFADNLITIQKGKPYPEPNKDWTAGTITTDVIGGINKINRAEYLKEWQENVDIIFSDKNINKLEAAFGPRYVEALKNSLAAMKSGSNRPLGGDRISNRILDWTNNSIGAVMFLNTRSAVLQTISSVNFINWGDNNLYAAGKAFGNQKQYWKDFLTLMNSDYLLERRDGLKINVSESEIADAVENSKNKATAAISYLLNKGFVFTRYADSFAIASGGATFYRNRIKSLMKEGMSQELAEQQAFEDFRLIAEENQQSSSPMRISQQQRSTVGRMVLAFGNTQMQYARIQKRAIQDLVNKRGDWKSNISKIVYYGGIQNLMFNGLQSALGWSLFDDDEDEKAKGKRREQKLQRTLNGMIDSQLKGLGIAGAVTSGVKNALMTIAEESGKKSPKFEEAIDDLINVMPAIGSKVRKLKSAGRTMSWNRKAIKEEGFSMDNPAYLAGAQVISGVTNIPVDEAAMKINTMRNILNPYTEAWQKVALALGWSTWDVDLPYWGLAEEKPVLTETEKQTKKLFDLNKSNQVKMLLDLGLTKKQIRALTKEEQRVQEIIKLQNKKKDGKDKS